MKVLDAIKTLSLVVCLAAGGMTMVTAGCSTDRTHESSDEATEDAAISARVVSALADTGGYKFSDVQVNTFKRRVQLSGFVDSDAHKNQAGTVAQQVDGIKEVINNITVK